MFDLKFNLKTKDILAKRLNKEIENILNTQSDSCDLSRY